MSRERSRRRDERHREQVRLAADRDRREVLLRRRHARRASVLDALLPRRTRWRRQQGLLARRRRAQNAVVALLALAANIVAWLVSDSAWLRLAAAVVTILALPVLVTLALDRRG